MNETKCRESELTAWFREVQIDPLATEILLYSIYLDE